MLCYMIRPRGGLFRSRPLKRKNWSGRDLATQSIENEGDGWKNEPSLQSKLEPHAFYRKVNFRLTAEFKFAQLGINELPWRSPERALSRKALETSIRVV